MCIYVLRTCWCYTHTHHINKHTSIWRVEHNADEAFNNWYRCNYTYTYTAMCNSSTHWCQQHSTPRQYTSHHPWSMCLALNIHIRTLPTTTCHSHTCKSSCSPYWSWHGVSSTMSVMRSKSMQSSHRSHVNWQCDMSPCHMPSDLHWWLLLCVFLWRTSTGQ